MPQQQSVEARLEKITSAVGDLHSRPWGERLKALQAVEALATTEPAEFRDAADIALASCLVQQLHDDRVQLVKQACFSIAAAAVAVYDKPVVTWTLMEGLLNTSPSNAGTLRYMIHASQLLCKHSMSERVFKRIAEKLGASRNKLLARTCAAALYASITESDEKLLEDMEVLVQDAVQAGMTCFDSKTRRYSVACAHAYKERVDKDAWAKLERALETHERESKMLKSFKQTDCPPLLLDLSHQRQEHEKREKRIHQKKVVLKKVRNVESKRDLPNVLLNLEDLQKQFAEFDKNDDGQISRYELAKVLQALGMPKLEAKQHAANFFRIADLDGSGKVDTEEFMVEFIRMQTLCAVRSLHRRFQKIDKNHDGEISKEELTDYLKSRITDAKIIDSIMDTLFKSIDRDHSGGVTIDELEEWYVRREDEIYESRMELAKMIKRKAKKAKEGKTTRITPGMPRTELSSETKLVVICGPSAVGKGTILGRLRKKYPGMFELAVSHTTRKPREHEVDGKHYHFVNKKKFEEMKDRKDFLEFADVHGKYYGTSKAAVNAVCEKGGICILEIDVQGAQAVRKSGVKANFLFITTSGGIPELEKRLRGRGTENEDKIQRRLKTSQRELSFLEKSPDFFDKVLVNDDLEQATAEMKDTFHQWYPHLSKSSSL